MSRIRIHDGANWSRRDFLRASGGCAALGTTSLVSSLLQMQLTRSAAAAAAPGDYRALVCVFLHGGNDSFNMLVPADADAYEAYRLARGNLALDQAGLHAIDAAVEYNQATAQVEIATAFPESTLGRGLRQVARAIGARRSGSAANSSISRAAAGTITTACSRSRRRCCPS